MAEVVKTSLLYSKDLFEKLSAKPEILKNKKDPLVEEMIKTCVNAKAKVVEQDLTEKNIRMQLNLGHTFGHALESRAGLGVVTHGDAVAWGMARAAELSKKLGICTSEYVDKIIKVLDSFGWETTPLHSAIKNKYKNEEEAGRELYNAMKKDKKNASSRVRFVLQEDIEETVITEAEEKDILSVLV